MKTCKNSPKEEAIYGREGIAIYNGM